MHSGLEMNKHVYATPYGLDIYACDHVDTYMCGTHPFFQELADSCKVVGVTLQVFPVQLPT